MQWFVLRVQELPVQGAGCMHGRCSMAPTLMLFVRGSGRPGANAHSAWERRSVCAYSPILYGTSFNLKTISQGDFGHFKEKKSDYSL